MSILDAFEARIDALVNGAFARAFNAEVQPVEIAAALQRELDDKAATLDEFRTITSNHFEVDLSSADMRRLASHLDTLRTELSAHVSEHAHAQQLTLVGPVAIDFAEDADLDVGVFRVRSASRQAPGAPAAGSPRLAFQSGEETPLVAAATKIGRSKDADIRIEDVGASRMHCEILLGERIRIRDLGSTNGTFVDGSRVADAELTDGSRITVGNTTFILRLS